MIAVLIDDHLGDQRSRACSAVDDPRLRRRLAQRVADLARVFGAHQLLDGVRHRLYAQYFGEVVANVLHGFAATAANRAVGLGFDWLSLKRCGARFV